MKVTRNRILALIASLVLLVSSIGLTLAYFSAYSAGAGEAPVYLAYSSEVTEEFDGLDKQITIANTGKSKVVVRAKIIGPGVGQIDISGDGWSLGGDGYWYYDKVLEPKGKDGDEASVLSAVVSNIPVTEDIDEFSVVVAHESAMVLEENGYVKKPAGWNAMPAIKL